MKALIVIDYTNDFVAADGALTCGEPGQAIEGRVRELVRDFLAEGDFVVMAVDAHREQDPYHPETGLYPPHNIIGTEGRNLYGSIQDIYEEFEETIYWMDKTRYSAFQGTDLALKLQERGITEIHLTGVCSDICVLHTAIEGFYHGFRVIIHEDAVASFNPDGHLWALGHFKNQLGMAVVTKQTPR